MDTGKRGMQFRLFLITAASVMVLASADAAPERLDTVITPRDPALTSHRREVVCTLKRMHYTFRTVLPRTVEFPARTKQVLYTGNTEADASGYITKIDRLRDFRVEMGAFTQSIESQTDTPIIREPDRRASLQNEMVTLDDLDTGKHQAMVARRGAGKQDLEGFVHIPTVWGEQLNPYRGDPREYWPANFGYGMRSTLELAEGIRRLTPVRAEVAPPVYLSSPALLRMPFLYITSASAFELTPLERENLGRYLRNGGFVFADNSTPQYENGAAEASLRRMFWDALGSRARFEPIPESHPLYHCFFDFEDGPPQGAEMTMSSTYTVGDCGGIAGRMFMNRPVLYLEGVFLDSRLVAVYSDKGYTQKWGREFTNSDPQLKMGVNLVMYALTREGGITQQAMEQYADAR